MAATPAGNRKIAAKLRERYGVDSDGKSKFHTVIGAQGGLTGKNFFRELAADNPQRMTELSRKGGASKRKV